MEVGQHGTYYIGSDAYPITVIEIKSPKKIVVQFDDFLGDKENGHDYYGIQVWKILRKENGRTEEFTWKPKKEAFGPKGDSSGKLILGRWTAKQDPSF